MKNLRFLFMGLVVLVGLIGGCVEPEKEGIPVDTTVKVAFTDKVPEAKIVVPISPPVAVPLPRSFPLDKRCTHDVRCDTKEAQCDISAEHDILSRCGKFSDFYSDDKWENNLILFQLAVTREELLYLMSWCAERRPVCLNKEVIDFARQVLAQYRAERKKFEEEEDARLDPNESSAREKFKKELTKSAPLRKLPISKPEQLAKFKASGQIDGNFKIPGGWIGGGGLFATILGTGAGLGSVAGKMDEGGGAITGSFSAEGKSGNFLQTKFMWQIPTGAMIITTLPTEDKIRFIPLNKGEEPVVAMVFHEEGCVGKEKRRLFDESPNAYLLECLKYATLHVPKEALQVP